jgi:hypothetical protein
MMKCPICGGNARDIAKSGFEGMSVRCAVDGDFDIAPGSALKLQEIPPAKRHYALNDAIIATRFGERPRIDLQSC